MLRQVHAEELGGRVMSPFRSINMALTAGSPAVKLKHFDRSSCGDTQMDKAPTRGVKAITFIIQHVHVGYNL